MKALTRDQTALLRRQIVRVAEGNLGFGESEGNNRGPFLRLIGAPDGSEWCAFFAKYAIMRAAHYAELEAIPGFQGSGNAKRLGKAVLASGNGWCLLAPGITPAMIAQQVLPGDLVVLHRGDSPYTGHVRIATAVHLGGQVEQIEGNSGGFPAVVRRRTTNPLKERLVGFYGFR